MVSTGLPVASSAFDGEANRHSINNLDLDAVFGGSATDLFDHEPENITSGSGSMEPEIITSDNGSKEPGMVTSGSSSNDADSITCTISIPPNHLAETGPKVFGPADRSCDWFWANGRPSETGHSPTDPMEIDQTRPDFHHQNFLGYPVHHRSSTPAAVSLWLALTSQKKQTSIAFSRKGVICAQATKLVDPFVFYGEDDTLQLCGTELHNAVVGLVERAYTDQGSWLYDCFDADDEVPRKIEQVKNQHYVFRDQDSSSWLPAPYWVSDDDEGVTAVNDGKRFSHLHPTRRCSDLAFRHTPSKLLTEHFADGTSAELKPPVIFVRPAEPKPAPSVGNKPTPSLPQPALPSDPSVFSPTPTPIVIIDNLIGEEIAAYQDAFRALTSFIPLVSLLSQPASEGDTVTATNAQEKAEGLGNSHPLSYDSLAHNQLIPAEVSSGEDLDLDLLAPMACGPITVAVGHKAFQLAGWVAGWF